VVNVEVVSDPVKQWLELPKMENPQHLFFTHYFTHKSSKTRNYSYYWDVENLVAHWVAYPLNDGLAGSGSRTDDWGLDPKLPRNMQPVLFRGFRGGYDRGHQLPSADRLTREANVQTFYGTNMTPQLGSLNQQGWASFEGDVRDWSRQFDTLYVVTGCMVEGSTKVAYDNDNKAVAVPTAYFKALLGYKKDLSIAASTAGYLAIGFYYPHEAYSGGHMEKSMTIDELEKKTGMDFFVNLLAKAGQSLADKIESVKDSWWSTH
jgi:endonuclease G